MSFAIAITKRLPFILVWVCSLLLLTGCAEKRIIVNGLDERSANEILVFLAAKGIPAQKVAQIEGSGGGGSGEALWNISVEGSIAPEAMALLNANGLPRKQGRKLLEIFGGGGLVSSEREQKIRYQSGLDAQIASTIRKFDGILDADVLISYPVEDELNPTEDVEKKKVTASVYVKHQGVLDDPNNHLIPKIKRLVASSVNGLVFENVTVVPDRSRFADLTMQAFASKKGADDQVRVWTLTIAKSSLTRFRVIFFSLISLLVFSFLILGFFFFKLSNFLKDKKGISLLCNAQPLEVVALQEKEEKKAKSKKEVVQEEVEEESIEVEEAEEETEEEE